MWLPLEDASVWLTCGQLGQDSGNPTMVIMAAWDQNVMCCWVPPSRRWSSFSRMSTAFSATKRRTTSRIPAGFFFLNHGATAKGVSGLPPPSLQEPQPPEGGDGSGPLSDSGEEGDRPPQRWRRCVCAHVHVWCVCVCVRARAREVQKIYIYMRQHGILPCMRHNLRV